MKTMEPWVGPAQPAIPIPESGHGNGMLRMRMSTLQVGDSFETDYSKQSTYRMARRLGFKVQCRAVDGKIKTIRVWRTE